jgi:hypothetical protein
MVSSLLSEEMRQKNMEGSNTDSLIVRVRHISRDKVKFSSGKYKLKGRSKSMVQLKRRCWKCGKVGYCKSEYKSKVTEISLGSDKKHLTDKNTTLYK